MAKLAKHATDEAKQDNQTLRQIFVTPAEQKLHQNPVPKQSKGIEVDVTSPLAEAIEPTQKVISCCDDMAIFLDMEDIEHAVETAMTRKKDYLEKAYKQAVAKGEVTSYKTAKDIKIPTLTQNVVKVIARTLEEFSKNNSHVTFKDVEQLKSMQVEQKASFTCKEFMERCGIQYTTTAAQILKEAVIVMHSIGYIFIDGYIKTPPKPQGEESEQDSIFKAYEQEQSKAESVTALRPFSKVEYKDGVFSVNFDIDYARALCSCYIMKLPDLYYKLNPNTHPYASKMLFYFYSLCRQKANLQGTTLKVKTILERTGFNIESAIAGRHRLQRLQEPFERDMDALSDVLTWEYTDAKGKPLSKNKMDKNFSIKEYLDLNVKITIRPAAIPYPKKPQKETKK